MGHTPVTESEAYLAALCGKTFLRMWSFPNLFRDQKHGGRGSHGKELCDLLVVFGEDVIIFSDKDCAYAADKPVEVAWPRWYRKAVLGSVDQLLGAERWISSHPKRIFIDRACTQDFPLKMPSAPRFHRVATCRGASGAVRDRLGGDGSLLVTNGPLDDDIHPFSAGAFTSDRQFVHVFDEVALEAVLRTMDTVADFCEYLQKREAFFRRSVEIRAASEADLLAVYLQSLDQAGSHDFVLDAGSALFVAEGFWDAWQASPQQASKTKADSVSYLWDHIVDKFCFHMMTGTQEFSFGGPVVEQELAVRFMAREGRVRRRMLAGALVGAVEGAREPGKTFRRLILPSNSGDPYWVLLSFHRPSDMSLERYRLARRILLEGLCMVVKHLHPQAEDVVGVAVSGATTEMSEDLLYLDARVWNEDLELRAKDLHERVGLFRDVASHARRVWEYPSDEQPSD